MKRTPKPLWIALLLAVPILGYVGLAVSTHLFYRGMPSDRRISDAIERLYRADGTVPAADRIIAHLDDQPYSTEVLDAYQPLATNAYAFVFPPKYAKVVLFTQGGPVYSSQVSLRRRSVDKALAGLIRTEQRMRRLPPP